MAPDARTSQVPLNLLEDPRVKYVRVTWVDLVNFVRYRVVPIAHFRKLVLDAFSSSSVTSLSPALSSPPPSSSEEAQKGNDGARFNAHPGITITKATMGLVYLTMAEGFSATGEYVYVPDLKAARLLSYAPGHANVFGWFQEKQVEADAVKVDGQDLFEVPLCPRTILKRIVQ